MATGCASVRRTATEIGDAATDLLLTPAMLEESPTAAGTVHG